MKRVIFSCLLLLPLLAQSSINVAQADPYHWYRDTVKRFDCDVGNTSPNLSAYYVAYLLY